MNPQLKESYGFVFEDELLREIDEVGKIHTYKAGTVILNYGQNVRSMPLLISGAIKILRQNEEGDELVLYYLERGDTCTMTMTCCLGQQKSEIKAVAETDTTFINIPVGKMQEWIKKYPSWMSFVFESYNERFNEMLTSIDNLAFHDMSARVHKYLKDQVAIKRSLVLNISHQEVAYDLNTSRVVISRILKKLEQEGKIELGRNKINVIDF